MADAPHYQGHRERLRDRFKASPTAMADYEVLELFLTFLLPRRDTKPIAKSMLHHLGGLQEVLRAQPEDLRRIDGLGKNAELFWKVLQELQARAEESPVKARLKCDHPAVVGTMAIGRLGALKTEEFWVALVDTRLRLMAWEQVSKGTIGHAPVYVREVLKLALERQAHGMILVHNHPGGDLKPSQEDLRITRDLMEGSKALEVRVLDHIIVTQEDYISLQMSGYLREEA